MTASYINNPSRDSMLHEGGGVGHGYGLHQGVLSPLETLAQSVSTMAPSTSPSLTVPLVFALAGNATWLVYLISTVAILLVGVCVSRFAAISASPGSLYSYTADTMPAPVGAVAGWALLLAYLATGGSVAGGALYYATLLCHQFFGFAPNAPIVLALVFLLSGAVAWRDVKLSAETMLWIEILSVASIGLLLVVLLWQHGASVDMAQAHLFGIKPRSLGPAIVLAMFSFVGFESATTLGTEARDPLRTIPRAVIQCALLAGVFFILCAYAEVLGFHGETTALTSSTSPLHLLAIKAGVAFVGTAIDIGAMISMFACVLACTTAAARVCLRMAQGGLLADRLATTHRTHGTPTVAILLSIALMYAATISLSARGVSGSDIYGWMGSVSVFGFLTAYALVALALPFARRIARRHSSILVIISVLTVLAMLAALFGSVYPIPEAPTRWFPYIYLGYLALGMLWYSIRRPVVTARLQGTDPTAP